MVERLRAQVRHAIWANALAWAAVLGVVAGGLYYVDQRDTQRQREICGLIIVSDDSYRANPPSLAGGKAFAKALHDYRYKIGCPDTPIPSRAPTLSATPSSTHS
jgi:hypothetical protein